MGRLLYYCMALHQIFIVEANPWSFVSSSDVIAIELPGHGESRDWEKTGVCRL